MVEYFRSSSVAGAPQLLALCCLTFEVRRDQRWDARPGLAKMYRVPPDRALWPAVGPRLDRGVRRSRCQVDAPTGGAPPSLEAVRLTGQGSRRSAVLRTSPKECSGEGILSTHSWTWTFDADHWVSSRPMAALGRDVRQVLLCAPNVRANRSPTAGRQARAGENVPRTARPGLVACRWCSG